jgi:hypothetical protein
MLITFSEKGNKSFTVSIPGPEPKPELTGDTRTFRVWLDPNQYQQDMVATEDGTEVCFCFYLSYHGNIIILILQSDVTSYLTSLTSLL